MLQNEILRHLKKIKKIKTEWYVSVYSLKNLLTKIIEKIKLERDFEAYNMVFITLGKIF